MKLQIPVPGFSRGERREIEHNFVPIKTWLVSADTGLSNLPGGVMMALLVHSIRKTFSVTWFKCMIVSSPNNCLILFDWYLENVPPELKLAFLMSTSSIRTVWRQFTTRGAHTGFDSRLMQNWNIHKLSIFGSDRSPRSQDVVRSFVRPLHSSNNEF